jgi:HPt (histidine-containing phosphotransfer) domain-containing protein
MPLPDDTEITDLPVFARNELLERLDGQAEHIPRLVSLYLKGTEENCRKLLEALENIDFHGVMAMAHAIKGSSAYIGANRLTDLANRLEDSAINGTPVDNRTQCQEIIREFEEFKKLYEESEYN